MKNLTLILTFLLILAGCQPNKNQTQVLEVALPPASSGVSYVPSQQWNGDTVLQWKLADAGKSILFDLQGKKLEDFNYLVCELYHENEYSLRIGYNFFGLESDNQTVQWQSLVDQPDSELAPRLGVKIGALPGLKTNIVFPLSHLDGQEIFLKRFSRQLRGTVSGHRIRKEEIDLFSLSVDPFLAPQFQPVIQIKRIYFSDKLPVPLETPEKPIVDKFGQWTWKEFKGKVKNEQDLVTRLTKLEKIAAQAKFPDDWSKYGGWLKKKFDANGYFQVKKEGEKWWLVDPEGYAFVSVGIDCIRPHSEGMAEDLEDLHEWLPEGDSLFDQCYSQRRGINMYDFFMSNLIRVYGTEWEEKWQQITAGLMREYGVNTIGNWSDIGFIKQAKMPYVFPLKDFPSTEIMLYRDFPDVFSEEYRTNAISFASQLKEMKDDPFMIGYFLRNEPHWAFGRNNIAFEMFAEDTPSESKKAFIGWLKEKYRDISQFNKAWQTSIASFEVLNTTTFSRIPSDAAEMDFWDFSEILVRKYVDVPCDEVEKIDPNHLNLGMRYAWVSSELLYEAGERFDIFSINGYSIPYAPKTNEISHLSGKPVMIGEFHFGSIDRGLPSTGIKGVASQEDRGKAYRVYMENGLSRDELIGAHFFQWIDQPVFGRVDGENYNIGVLSIAHIPYEETANAMKKTNRHIYEIITGEVPVYDNEAEVIPPIHF